VTRYTVLEVRIHLDDPAQLTWLLRGSNPALPRIISEVRPLVLPKLREEYERARGKTAAKKRGVKDTVTQGMCWHFILVVIDGLYTTTHVN
jgi:hypothetical protein